MALTKNKNNQNLYGVILTVLLGLFAFRVSAQLIQLIFPVDFLPHFNSWHSGALPYPILVVFQVIIIAACIKVIVSFFKENAVPSRLKGGIYTIIGAIYFLVMIARLAIGIIYPDANSWFLVKIPTCFHLVLASFLLVLGHYHLKFSKAQQ
jgi:hypothetical protein